MSKTAIDMGKIIRRGEDHRVEQIRSEIAPETRSRPEASPSQRLEPVPDAAPVTSRYSEDLRPPPKIPTVSMSIRLPVDMHETLKIRSFKTGVSIQRLINAALERALMDNFV